MISEQLINSLELLEKSSINSVNYVFSFLCMQPGSITWRFELQDIVAGVKNKITCRTKRLENIARK